MGSNLRCVTLCQLFNLSELQEMENENLKSTLRKKHTAQGYEGIKYIKQGDAHRARGTASDAVSTQCSCSVYDHTGLLLFREPGGLSGVADFVSEASRRPGPAPGMGRSGQRRAWRQTTGRTRLPARRAGGGKRAEERQETASSPHPWRPSPAKTPNRPQSHAGTPDPELAVVPASLVHGNLTGQAGLGVWSHVHGL